MDNISSERRSENMRAIRSEGTMLELRVKQMLRELGVRFRMHVRRLPGNPDFVFPAIQKVIFVHGCFWHQHSSKRCGISRIPKSRLEYWSVKLEKNVKSDRSTRRQLKKIGWSSIVIWECQVRKRTAYAKIARFLACK